MYLKIPITNDKYTDDECNETKSLWYTLNNEYISIVFKDTFTKLTMSSLDLPFNDELLYIYKDIDKTYYKIDIPIVCLMDLKLEPNGIYDKYVDALYINLYNLDTIRRNTNSLTTVLSSKWDEHNMIIDFTDRYISGIELI